MPTEKRVPSLIVNTLTQAQYEALENPSDTEMWVTPYDESILPDQTGQSGKFLTTNGTNVSWATVNALPSQTGQNGKFLTTDGTDASWAEIPADFADLNLSNLTNEGKNISNWSINVSNCITNIPQDIKLELNNGTLTLKAGSKVYVPNGSGIFNVVTIANDITYGGSSTSFSNTKWLVRRPNGVLFVNNGDYTSGSTYTGGTYGIWYDTTNNIVKYTNNGGSTWTNGYSLPLAQITVASGTGVTSIDKVFNGFGYIGSTIFALPDVKCLIPNGRNTDGSLNNIETTVNSVSTQTYPSNFNLSNFYICIGTGGQVATGYNEYIEYKNILRNVGQTSQILYCQVGIVSTTNGAVNSFTTKTPFHALDYNNREIISGWGMPSTTFISLTLGASDSTYTAPAIGYLFLSKKANGNNQEIRMINNTNGMRSYICANNGMNMDTWIPCKKNDTIKIYYSAGGDLSAFLFVYAEGSKSEGN